jgi:mannose-1-phosphate guanylyltransferase
MYKAYSLILIPHFVKDHSIVKHSIVGWDSKLGQWCRVEGSPEPYPNSSMTENGKKIPNVTVLGAGISLSSESMVRNCVVLPNKELKNSYHNEILM